MIIERYDYFLLDLDRTLWNFDANALAAMHMLLDKWNLPIGDRETFFERYEVINRRLWDDYEAGIIAKEYLRRERFHQTLREHYGIDDTVCYKAQFLDVIGADVKGIMRKAEQEIEKDLERDA